jgi:hypothetical protein
VRTPGGGFAARCLLSSPRQTLEAAGLSESLPRETRSGSTAARRSHRVGAARRAASVHDPEVPPRTPGRHDREVGCAGPVLTPARRQRSRRSLSAHASPPGGRPSRSVRLRPRSCLRPSAVRRADRLPLVEPEARDAGEADDVRCVGAERGDDLASVGVGRENRPAALAAQAPWTRTMFGDAAMS